MNKKSMTYIRIPAVLLFAIFSLVIFNSPGNAGDYSMQSNLDSISQLMSIWSKQLSSGKMANNSIAGIFMYVIDILFMIPPQNFNSYFFLQ